MPNEVFGYTSKWFDSKDRNNARFVNRVWRALLHPSLNGSIETLKTIPELPKQFNSLRFSNIGALIAFEHKSNHGQVSADHLDLSHFQSLKKIDKKEKYFLSISKANSEIFELLRRITKLQSLNLADQQDTSIEPLDIRRLANICRTLTSINLSGNDITDVDTNPTPQELSPQVFPMVTYLNLSNISITTLGLNNLLPWFPHLTYLNISKCKKLHEAELTVSPRIRFPDLRSLHMGFITTLPEDYDINKNHYLGNVVNFLLNTECTQLETLSLDGCQNISPNLHAYPYNSIRESNEIPNQIKDLLLMALKILPNLRNVELDFKEHLIPFTEELCINSQRLDKLKLSNPPNQTNNLIELLAAGYFSNTQISGKIIDGLRSSTSLTVQTLNQEGLANLKRYCSNASEIENGATENFSYVFKEINLLSSQVTAEILNEFLPSCLNLISLTFLNCPKLNLNQLLFDNKMLKALGNLNNLTINFKTLQLYGLEQILMAANNLEHLLLNGKTDTNQATDLQELVAWLEQVNNRGLNHLLENRQNVYFVEFFSKDLTTIANFLDTIDNFRSTTQPEPIHDMTISLYLADDISEDELIKLIKSKRNTDIQLSNQISERQPLRTCTLQMHIKKRPTHFMPRDGNCTIT